MAKAKRTAVAATRRRHVRLRKRVLGTPKRPRLAVFRSNKHVYAQVIDDKAGQTLVAASDLEQPLRSKSGGKGKTEVAALVGELLAKKAVEKKISEVVFDRGGFKFHGRVKALAEAARQAGLKF